MKSVHRLRHHKWKIHPLDLVNLGLVFYIGMTTLNHFSSQNARADKPAGVLLNSRPNKGIKSGGKVLGSAIDQGKVHSQDVQAAVSVDMESFNPGSESPCSANENQSSSSCVGSEPEFIDEALLPEYLSLDNSEDAFRKALRTIDHFANSGSKYTSLLEGVLLDLAAMPVGETRRYYMSEVLDIYSMIEDKPEYVKNLALRLRREEQDPYILAQLSGQVEFDQ